ncbi:MAG: ATP-binding protein, partial [Acidobacteriota bacterium]
PLTPIRLSAEHLQRVGADDPSRLPEVLPRCTRNILRQVDALREIASEFSTYSRIPRARFAPVDLGALLRELADGYRDAAHAGEGAEVVCDAPDDDALVVVADRRLLERAVRNLLENALRASAGRGTVRLDAAADAADTQVVVRVADRGPGVETALLPRIFEPYFSTHDTGTGLGLPIVRRIVEEHDGTVHARNRAGGGLEVVITMPLRHAHTAAVHPVPVVPSA